MKVIGVTGGIGSGKSTVSGILRDLGAVIIDADIIARDVIKKGLGAYNELVSYFGAGILDKTNEIDRHSLAKVAFDNKEDTDALNAITHKYISNVILQELEACKNIQRNVVIDAAIPIKCGFLDVADRVWVVVASMENRIKRVMARSGLSHCQILNRIKAQPEDDYYYKMADIIIQNNGTLEELSRTVKANYRGIIF
ncbi:MAG: dephospho-CoA kinase [Clostridium sp.]|nr:dephospho-CoA kinase [Clostridium sp.]